MCAEQGNSYATVKNAISIGGNSVNKNKDCHFYMKITVWTER
jgi:hypothetical protein